MVFKSWGASKPQLCQRLYQYFSVYSSIYGLLTPTNTSLNGWSEIEHEYYRITHLKTSGLLGLKVFIWDIDYLIYILYNI